MPTPQTQTNKPITSHNLGFPRIGAQRELKHAQEAYWRGDSDAQQLAQTGAELRARHWQQQADAGLDLIPVGDFSFYDQVLDMSCLLGVVPPRFLQDDNSAGNHDNNVALDTYFRMARGRAPSGEPTAACEMTKWFDTNYHYLVPEFLPEQTFRLASSKLFDEVREAQALGHRVKPVILGPLSFLWLGKCKTPFDPLSLLKNLIPVYNEILQRLAEQGVEWLQIDEPVLALDLTADWKAAFEASYFQLQTRGLKRLLATYFGPLRDNLSLACKLPVDGLHIDAVRAADEVNSVVDWLPGHKVLSVGIIDGRNIWRSDLDAALQNLESLREHFSGELWIAPSCSLLHVPVDLQQETQMDEELKSWLAFATQKMDELVALQGVLNKTQTEEQARTLRASQTAILSRQHSDRIHRSAVKDRTAAINSNLFQRQSYYLQRAKLQQQWLQLPAFPTTTIGSFPQTTEIRQARRAFKNGDITEQEYQQQMRDEILITVKKQETLGLDVLVHGEPERNDMVEYFGEQLDGFAFTTYGWVQSYGSRCVKPPIIFGDVSRPQPMTVEWTQHAQSLTHKPMKGMLTGPVTILNWSFVRDDQPRATTCQQIALALRDEVLDLETAGIGVIQIDEAALREGLPLRQADWKTYLDWAVQAFHLTAAGVKDRTQIHTHMCYAEFNDIIEAVAAMDADVITIETSRSDMELLNAFENFVYPNEIGPGVYDIHSPNVPSVQQIVALMKKARKCIPAERLWVNPDCGLKTRHWPEVEAALQNMVAAAHYLRKGSPKRSQENRREKPRENTNKPTSPRQPA